MVQHVPSMHKALDSSPCTETNQNRSLRSCPSRRDRHPPTSTGLLYLDWHLDGQPLSAGSASLTFSENVSSFKRPSG